MQQQLEEMKIKEELEAKEREIKETEDSI